jgi:hypothetical protein
MKILIKAVGFIGDNLFGSSIPKKLKEQYNYDNCEVDYLLTLPQPFELISLNPYIDNVYLTIPDKKYDKVYQLSSIHRKLTPCEQFQTQCGVISPSPEFKIYTNELLDEYVKYCFLPIKDKKIIAWLSNWEERSFIFTSKEYENGIDVPGYGYGGKHRNISSIIDILSSNPEVFLIEVGKPNGTDQKITDISTVSEYSLTASILKNCHFFIGAEGGLANLASGVGTKTILTGDFVHQLYGWNGVIEKCEEPRLGPKYYFGEENHKVLDPYSTDKQVAQSILNLIL